MNDGEAPGPGHNVEARLKVLTEGICASLKAERDALRSATLVVLKTGEQLAEAKELLRDRYGEWGSYLEGEFSLSEDTAARYIKAATFRKLRNLTEAQVANLSRTVLYDLADGVFDAESETAILKQAELEKVKPSRARAIARKDPAPKDWSDELLPEPDWEALEDFDQLIVDVLYRHIRQQGLAGLAATDLVPEELQEVADFLRDLARLARRQMQARARDS
jgi:hypothetical protein